MRPRDLAEGYGMGLPWSAKKPETFAASVVQKKVKKLEAALRESQERVEQLEKDTAAREQEYTAEIDSLDRQWRRERIASIEMVADPAIRYNIPIPLEPALPLHTRTKLDVKTPALDQFRYFFSAERWGGG